MVKKRSDKILFASGPHDMLVPLYACGHFSEMELHEFGLERDWSDSIPAAPGVGLWVWEFTPSGGGPNYWGECDDVDIDRGEWRPLNFSEWHFIQNGECPWVPKGPFPEEENPKFELGNWLKL
jgi:hypothetical protein